MREKYLILAILIFYAILSFPRGYSFQIAQQEDYLVQLEVDFNYPCYVSEKNSINCPEMNQTKEDEWIQWVIENYDGRDRGRIISAIQRGEIPFIDTNGRNETVNHRQNFNISIDLKQIKNGSLKIGFDSNVFGISSVSPEENYIIDIANGNISYQPFNNTFFNFTDNDFGTMTKGLDIYTASFWVNITGNPSGNRFLFNNSAGAVELIRTDNSNLFLINNGTANRQSSTPLIRNNYTHYVFTFNGTTYLIYMNGELNSTVWMGGRTSPIRANMIGKQSGNSIQGEVADFRIYNDTLNQTKIDTLFSGKRNPPANCQLSTIQALCQDTINNLVAYWRFGSWFSNVTYDSSKNGNNLTLTFSSPSKSRLGNDGIYVSTKNYYTGIELINITQGFIFYGNGSLLKQNFSGNLTMNFLNRGDAFILENFNLTEGVFFNHTPMWIKSQQEFLSESQDTKTYHLGSNLTNPISNISFITTTARCPQVGDTVKFTSVSGTFTTPSYVCSGNRIHFTLHNYENTGENTDNSLMITYNKEPQSGGGGGGGQKKEVDGLLCNETYDYLKIHKSQDYSGINQLIFKIKEETGKEFAWTEVRDYLDNWQSFCPEIVDRTLREDFVCEKVFFFLINNSGQYSVADIFNLNKEIKNEISISDRLLKIYSDQYETKCAFNNMELPFSREVNQNTLNFFNSLEKCAPNLNFSIFGFPMETSIPFFNIYQGEIGCEQIDIKRWLFKLETEDGKIFIITGLKLWAVLSFMVILIIIVKRKNKNKKIGNNG